jgi:CheY-like chemotaxis protein
MSAPSTVEPAHRGHQDQAAILVVEDDPVSRDAVCEILDHAGYAVMPAENGLRAFESVETGGVPPALVLLDLAMPIMDGLTFLSQVPRHPLFAKVPIIVMSGDVKALRLRVERPIDVMDVLPKPIDLERMMALVRKHIGSAPVSSREQSPRTAGGTA